MHKKQKQQIKRQLNKNFKTIQTKKQFYLTLFVNVCVMFLLFNIYYYSKNTTVCIVSIIVFFHYGVTRFREVIYGHYFDDQINKLEWEKDRLFDIQKMIDIKK